MAIRVPIWAEGLTRKLLRFWDKFDRGQYSGEEVMRLVTEDCRRGHLGIPSFVE